MASRHDAYLEAMGKESRPSSGAGAETKPLISPKTGKKRLKTIKERGPTTDQLYVGYGRVIGLKEIVGSENLPDATKTLDLYHTSLHLRRIDKNGNVVAHRVLEAGPERVPDGIANQAQAIAADMVTPHEGPNGPWGKLLAVERLGHRDPDQPKTTILEGRDLSKIWEVMRKAKEQMDTTQVQYRPLRSNSNTFTGALLEAANLPRPTGKSDDGQTFWIPGTGEPAVPATGAPAKAVPAVPGQRDYGKALVDVMAEAAKGAVILNVGAPKSVPNAARVGLAIIGAAGWGGLAAARVVWRGATNRNLMEPRDITGAERAAGQAIAAGVTATAIAAGITGRVAKSANIGGRVALAAGSGAVAAEAVHAVGDVLINSQVGAHGKDLLVSMQQSTRDAINSAKAETGNVLRSVYRSAISQYQGLRKAVGLGSGTDATAKPAPKPLPPPAGSAPIAPTVGRQSSFIDQQLRQIEQKKALAAANTARVTGETAQKRQAQQDFRAAALALRRKSIAKVNGFWRERRTPSGQLVREFVHAHTRRVTV
jgi:hypothetical protein